MNRREAFDALSTARSARLATISPDGWPQVVPVTFAIVDEQVVTMVDHKPKTTSRLQRLANIEQNPRASILADHYEENWDALWWVRVDGQAELHDGDDVWEASRQALASKYPQYRGRHPEGAAIVMTMDRLVWWSSTP